MASIHGFMDGSSDYKHMYRIKDLCGELPQTCYNPDTILHYLHIHGYDMFATLIKQSQLAGIYNDKQGDFTLFVPTNEATVSYLNTDSYKQRQLVLLHSLEHAVPYVFLRSSGAMYVNTRLPGTRLLVENVGLKTPMLNRCTRIIGSATVGNAQLFFIDNIIRNNTNPMAF